LSCSSISCASARRVSTSLVSIVTSS
jgi:hypothetical protein